MYLSALTTHSKTSKISFCLGLVLFLINFSAQAQISSTSWDGSRNSKWEEPENWSNGLPDTTKHVFIGDISFNNQPESKINNQGANSGIKCLSLTVGGGGSAVTLKLENEKGLYIKGDLYVNSNGTIINKTTNIIIRGNWINNGTYTEEVTVQNQNWVNIHKVDFGGTDQTIGGASETKFLQLDVWGSLTLQQNVTIDLANYNYGNLIVHGRGIIDPQNYKISWGDSNVGKAFRLMDGATILVKAQNYLDNYSIRPTAPYNSTSTIEHTNTIDYAGTIDQNIDDQIIYQKLFISGSGVKSLVGNTTISSGAANTEVNVKSATLDLKTFTLTRQAAGGNFIVAADAKVKIGGPANSPVNFTTRTFAPTSTVEYYGDAQTVQHNTYGHLTLSTSGIKTMPDADMTIQGNLTSSRTETNTVQFTAKSNLTINGNVNFGSGTVFIGGNYTHTIAGNWLNNGTFNPGAGTISLVGGNNTTIAGGAIFNVLTINKTAVSNNVTLANNATATMLNMTQGELHTGVNRITILGDRTGDGWVLGTVNRQHAFTPGTAYAFNSRFSTMAFTGGTGVTEATMTTGTATLPTGFVSGKSIHRLYEITVAPDTYANGSLQLHYQDSELNDCVEDGLKLYYSPTGTGAWTNASRHSYNATQNWVRRNTITNLTGFWTLTDNPSTYIWDGTESIAWEDGRNWEVITDGASTRGITGPISSDFVILGKNIPVEQRQPTITTDEWVRDISFTEPNAMTLTLSAGSLRTNYNIATVGAGTALQHILNAGAQTITIGGNLVLNDGNAGNNLDISAAAATIHLTGNLEQHQTGNISLGGSNLNIGGNYNYTSGNFTAGSSTVTYNGTGAQVVAGLPYHHLTISKTAGTATLTATTTQGITGNLTVAGGAMALSVPTINVAGDVIVTAGTLEGNGSTIDLKGNWNRTGGTFTPGSSTVIFSGTNPQTVAGTTFHNLSKTTANTVTTTGASTLSGNLNVQSGTLVLAGHTMDRTSAGGALSVADGATLRINSVNYPANYSTNSLGVNSNVIYSGGTAGIAGVTYGNVFLQDAAARPLLHNTRVANQMTILSGAMLSNSAAVYTLTLDKDLTSDGTIDAQNINLAFTNPTAMLIGAGTGVTIVKDVTIVSGGGLTVSKDITLHGSLINNGNSFSAPANWVDFRGGVDATITSANPVTINELRVNKTDPATLVKLEGNINGLQTVHVVSGTLDAANRVLTRKAATGTSLTIANAATMKVAGNNSLPLFNTYSLQPASTVVYNGFNQTINSVQYGHLELQNVGTATFEAGIAKVAGNMTKGSEATVITPQTIEFNGTGPQNMPGVDYKNLLISANGDKTLTANATIVNSLTFATGLTNAMLLASGLEITLSETATLAGEQEGSHIVGTIKTTRDVPKNTTTTFGGIGIEINPGVDAGVSTMTRVTGQAIGQDGNSIQRYYRFQAAQNAGKLNASIKASYLLAELDRDGIGADHEEDNLVLYSARFLEDGYTALSDMSNHNVAAKSIAVNGINSINYLTISSPVIKPLPVELVYFKADKQDNSAVLEWKTASEKNNSGFEVEVSADGYSYQKIGFVQSAVGTSAIAQNYTFTDSRNGKNGILYYRLRQLNEDGTFKFYGPRTVNFGAVTKTAIVAYPNPFESEVKLAIETANSGNAKLTLYTTAGKVITQHQEPLAKGSSVLQLNLNQNLPRGLYLLTIEQNGEVETLKLIKN